MPDTDDLYDCGTRVCPRGDGYSPRQYRIGGTVRRNASTFWRAPSRGMHPSTSQPRMVSAGIPSTEVSPRYVTPSTLLAACTRSPSVRGGGCGSYPRKRMIARQCRIPGAVCPDSQLRTVCVQTPRVLAVSAWVRPRSSRARLRWFPRVERSLG